MEWWWLKRSPLRIFGLFLTSFSTKRKDVFLLYRVRGPSVIIHQPLFFCFLNFSGWWNFWPTAKYVWNEKNGGDNFKETSFTLQKAHKLYFTDEIRSTNSATFWSKRALSLLPLSVLDHWAIQLWLMLCKNKMSFPLFTFFKTFCIANFSFHYYNWGVL